MNQEKRLSAIFDEDNYPSRKNDKEKITNRIDPVVYGYPQPHIEHSLSEDQLSNYENNGFIVLPDYMPEVVEPLLEEIDSLKESMKGREELITEPGSEELRSLFKPSDFSNLIDEFSRHPKVLTIAKQLLGSDVYLTQSRVNVKPAFKGKSFPWHSDFETWHVEDGMPRMRALTAWIMLTDNNEHNGPLYVIPGSHKKFVSCAGSTKDRNYDTSLKNQMAGVPNSETMECLLKNSEIKGVYGKPGTVVFHECNLMHGSPDNISDLPRTLLMFVYNSCKNELVAPFSEQRPRPGYLRNPDTSPLSILTNSLDRF